MTIQPPSLSIIGCGKLGRSLGKLLHSHSVFAIQDIVASSTRGAEIAQTFLGVGHPCSSVAALQPADAVLIATPDSVIAEIAGQLLSSNVVRRGAVVFHCSGALGSEVLGELRHKGAYVASVHPVKSFSSPSESVQTFSGTYCAIEGDEPAIALLTGAFEAIGAKLFSVRPDAKLLYHATFVFACNYLTALMECAFQCSTAAGIERTTVVQMIEPLVRETMAAVMSRGVDSALTGPVARGDAQVVASQLASVSSLGSEYADIYRLLGQVALEIAERGGGLSEAVVERTRQVLQIR